MTDDLQVIGFDYGVWAQKNGVRGINAERGNRSKVQILINQQHREGEV